MTFQNQDWDFVESSEPSIEIQLGPYLSRNFTFVFGSRSHRNTCDENKVVVRRPLHGFR